MLTGIGLHAFDQVVLAVHRSFAGDDVGRGGERIVQGGEAVEGDDTFAHFAEVGIDAYRLPALGMGDVAHDLGDVLSLELIVTC